MEYQTLRWAIHCLKIGAYQDNCEKVTNFRHDFKIVNGMG